jgi:hypothetical protein
LRDFVRTHKDERVAQLLSRTCQLELGVLELCGDAVVPVAQLLVALGELDEAVARVGVRGVLGLEQRDGGRLLVAHSSTELYLLTQASRASYRAPAARGEQDADDEIHCHISASDAATS